MPKKKSQNFGKLRNNLIYAQKKIFKKIKFICYDRNFFKLHAKR